MIIIKKGRLVRDSPMLEEFFRVSGKGLLRSRRIMNIGNDKAARRRRLHPIRIYGIGYDSIDGMSSRYERI